MRDAKAFGGEASSSRRKRQRHNSTVDGNEVITTEERSGMLFELDLLDCPICCHPLTTPIFQCGNGHIACSSCCTNMRKKCPSCNLSIGINRCRFAERVVETSIVSCPNAKYGCTQKFSYGKELAHEKECEFVLCYCPASNCDYTSVYQDLYSHYDANHKNVLNRIVCGSSHNACVSRDDILVLEEYRDGSLVVVQSFKTQQGVNVTVNCIAPCAPGVGKFSYEFAYSLGDYTMTFGSGEMKRIQKVSFQTPEEGFMSVPHYFMGDQLKGMDICIRRLEEEEEEDDDDDDDDAAADDDDDEEEDEDEEEEQLSYDIQ